jgi:uncharacterized protein with ParB-like and HNH nuclease domain
MNNLKGETVHIGKLFSEDFFFRVPEYQRPFSWVDDHFDDLVNDLLEADRGQEYFLGTLVLQRKDQNNNYDVVDGQQRLTAISILLACIRDRLEDKKFKDRLHDKLLQTENVLDGVPQKIRLEVKDRKIFNEIVITIDGTLSKRSERGLPEPEWRYVRAVNIFREKLDRLDQSDLQSLSKFISQKCVLIYLSTSTFDDAFRLFTIVNDRGKQLRRIDILKSVNIDPTIVRSDTVRNKIAQQWEDLEKEVGETTFESIFHLIRFIFIKEKPQGDLLKEFEERIFKKNLVSKGEKFVDLVVDYVSTYKSLFDDRDIDFDDEITSNKYKSLMFIMNSEFDASEWKACVLFFAKKFEGKYLFEFLLKIEKVYMEQWVKGIRKDERYKAYSDILRLIDDSNTPVDVINKISYNTSVIKEACDNENFYGAGYSKYFLLRLELLAAEHDTAIDFVAKSIEHVLPQNPKANSDWAQWNNLAEVKSYVNKIGNLVLLSKSKNSSAKNYNFQVKKERYLTPRVTSYPRSVEILSQQIWDKSIIE